MGNKLFFQHHEDYEDDSSWFNLIRRAVEEDWDVRRSGVWIHANFKAASALDRGFKIHISPDMDRLAEQVQIVTEFLVSERVTFKVLRDANLVNNSVSKTYSRTASGKFFTIYPDSRESFLKLCNLLTARLDGFRGPYILTDRQVPGSSVVFYRYGAFASITELGGGDRIHRLLRNLDGNLVLDRREPGRAVPEWIDDPFPPSTSPKAQSRRLLKGRYTIKCALAFSNRGGVYQAIDEETGRLVVIKEARARSGYIPKFGYASDHLRREFAILRELESSCFSVRSVDFFEEWGHSFLVEEFVPDIPLHSLYASPETTLIPFLRGRSTPLAHLRKLLPLLVSAIEGVSNVHCAGYSIGDISPRNLLVNTNVGKVTLIDVETCVKMAGDDLSGSLPTTMRTPGFTPPKGDKFISAFESDWYVLAKCFSIGSIGLQAIPDLGGMDDRAILHRFCSLAALPESFESIMLQLMAGDWASALNGCRALIDDLNGITNAPACCSAAFRRPVEDENPEIFMSPEFLASQIATGLLNDQQSETKSTLWPASPEGSEYTKWCFLYGAAGVAYALQLQGTRVADSVLEGLRRSSVGARLNPSLFYGTAGIAMSLNVLSFRDEAESILMESDTTMLAEVSGVASGLAGLGLVLVSYWESTLKNDSLLIKACEIGRQLAALGSHGDTEEMYWTIDGRSSDVFYGYQHGVAGIAYFMGRLAAATGDKSFLKISREAISFVLNRRRIDEHGRPFWGIHKDHPFQYPYLGNGGCGIGAAFIRLGHIHSDSRLVDEAKLIADGSFSALALSSGVVKGVAGIGMFMQDMRDLTGDVKYQWLSQSIERSLQTYCVIDAESSSCRFPGTLNRWISCDYGTGSAGILDFYTRQTSKLGNFMFDLGCKIS